MTGPEHSCGVVGISADFDVASALHTALMIIQHRGQESAGISVFNGSTIETVKGNGLVTVALPKEEIQTLLGHVGVGHVRYSTTGSKSIQNAQPLTVMTNFGTVAVAHNGDITNFAQLKEKYMKEGWTFLTDSDSELVTKLLGKYMTMYNDPVKAIRAAMGELDGSFSITMLINDRLFAIRDMYGFRPLCLGKIDGGYIAVSESAAIDALRGELIRDIEPGEILARECPADVDLVMPVPDSGRAHAIGYSCATGIPYEEGFMKNRFADRTFIMPDQKQRESAVSMKMNPIKSTVNGKRIMIVDDSIVRGTTLKKLVAMLRKAGAKEVHVRVGSPPIIAPCYYGVDMKSRDQFIANKHSVEEIREIIGADSLGYISIEGLIEAIGFKERDLCLACVNGKYPTSIPGEVHRFQTNLRQDFN